MGTSQLEEECHMSDCFLPRISLGSAICLAAISCAPEPSGSVSRDQTLEYSVGINAPELSRLPKCTTALNGAVAHIDSPSSLWTCAFGRWKEIPCSTSSAGDIAYAGTEQTLWACVKNTWTPIAVPSGAPGLTGPAGPAGVAGRSSLVRVSPEPVGSNCAEGGIRIETGIDDDADSVLDSGEVDSTAYTCNGAAPAICGDGVVGPTEQCDPGPTESKSCDSDCTVPACGDNHLNAAAAEECEDGNKVSGDGCSRLCRIEPVSCAAGNLQCLGNGVQTCGTDGKFGAVVPCSGTQLCVFGTCLERN